MLLIIVSLCPLPPKPLITCPHVFFLWCDPVLKKNHGEGRVCGEMVVEYQKSLMGFLICHLSSILSIFLNQEFSFCTQMEPSFDFWLLLKIHWLQNNKPPSMSSKKEKLCGGEGEWVAPYHLPVTQYIFLSCSFAYALFRLGAHFQCVTLLGESCTRWWQWKLIRQGYTGCGFPAEPGQFLPAFGTKQHLLRDVLLAAVANPDEFLSHQSDCFTTANLN